MSTVFEDRHQIAKIEATSAQAISAPVATRVAQYQIPVPVQGAELGMALAAIDGFAAMVENWDGYQAARIAEAAVANARRALETLLTVTPCPDLSPNPNGTISMEWESDAGYAVLEIGNSRFSFYIKVGAYRPYSVAGDASEISTLLGQQISGSLYPTQRSSGYRIASVIALPSYVRTAY